jgi:hypothetical protein
VVYIYLILKNSTKKIDMGGRRMIIVGLITGLILLALSCSPPDTGDQDIFSLAMERKDDLRLGIYFTAHAVEQLLTDEMGRREAISLLKANGVTKVFIEVYRSGLVVDAEKLQPVIDFFRRQNFEVVGAIATVPGDNFGIRQEARYSWFNWEAEKTRADLARVMQESAPLFDSFIVDDFLCTADTSLLSKKAKGDRTWPAYRRDLLTAISDSVFIRIPKRLNPDITMIIKYPQWYDRYHLFGYDVTRQNQLFDKVWIGTETRGQYTPRFGYVQPYEGFINYRWMASLAGRKMGGAWFDHIDCDQHDFIDQAYQSVLAGASELTLFNYFNFVEGHPGQHLLRMEFENLANLARQVKRSPVAGIPASKPPDSDAGGDLYLMDYIGMLGIPLIPVSVYPEDAEVVFLPRQAAFDPGIINRIKNSLGTGARIIVTAGFLAGVEQGEELARLAGIRWPIKVQPAKGRPVTGEVTQDQVELEIEIETDMEPSTASVLLEVEGNGGRIPYLTASPDKNLYVLNSHTFSQADFDAVGEVLLCPGKLGLMEIPDEWAHTIRAVFNEPLGIGFKAPVRVTFQPFGENEIMVHVEVDENFDYYNVLDGMLLPEEGSTIRLEMPGRSRIWIRRN